MQSLPEVRAIPELGEGAIGVRPHLPELLPKRMSGADNRGRVRRAVDVGRNPLEIPMSSPYGPERRGAPNDGRFVCL